MTRPSFAVAVAAAFITGPAVQAGFYPFDSFSLPDSAFGERVLGVDVHANPFDLPVPATAEVIEGDPGFYTFSSGPGVIASSTISYPNASMDAAKLGVNAFEFTFFAADFDFMLTIELITKNDDMVEIGSAIGESMVGAGDEFVPVSIWTFIESGAYDASDIDEIVITFNGPDGVPSLDVALADISLSVPAPSALALLGVAGAMGRRRRRRA